MFTTDSENNDGWASRLLERDKILNFIENNHVSGVTILSGDKVGRRDCIN